MLKKNRKIFLILVISIFLISCNSLEKKYLWYSPKKVIENSHKLQSGDILILSKKLTPKSIWGHAAILNENKKIVEFPSYSTGYNENPLFIWSNLDRKISVFRLKNINEDLKKILFEEIEKTILKPYGITFDKHFDKRLYCSQFVYLVYKKAGNRLEKDIDLDYNGGIFVMPFDILQSELLENISLD